MGLYTCCGPTAQTGANMTMPLSVPDGGHPLTMPLIGVCPPIFARYVLQASCLRFIRGTDFSRMGLARGFSSEMGPSSRRIYKGASTLPVSCAIACLRPNWRPLGQKGASKLASDSDAEGASKGPTNCWSKGQKQLLGSHSYTRTVGSSPTSGEPHLRYSADWILSREPFLWQRRSKTLYRF